MSAVHVSHVMVDAYLVAQRRAVEEADRFGRPNIGGLHTNTVRAATRAGLEAALAVSGGAVAPQAPAPTHREQLAMGADRAEALLAIGRQIGFGRAQQILGEQWEAEHDCAPRGRMGVTIGKCNPPKSWNKRGQDAYRRGWDEAIAAQTTAPVVNQQLSTPAPAGASTTGLAEGGAA